MKPVLPRIAEFGEELGAEVDGVTGQRGQGYKRHANRPSAPHKLTHWPLAEALPDVASPSSINLMCTGMREQCAVDELARKATGQHKSHKGRAEAYGDLRQLQAIWEGQKQLTPTLSQFTVVGQRASRNRDHPTVFLVKDIPTDVPVDGRTEWKAVTWRLPQYRNTRVQLSCLLFCKGVRKAELPRVSIADWKPGNMGIPTFHCERCLRHWFKSGGLLTECSDPENIIEGPAMCITFSDQTSSEMIVSGFVGKDGKPIRIKVESPEAIKRFLTRKTTRTGRGREAGKKGNGQRETDGGKQKRKRGHGKGGDNKSSKSSFESESDYSVHGSDEENDEILDLPENVRRYILKKERRRRRKERNIKAEDGAPSDADDEILSTSQSTSSFSSSDWNSADESHEHYSRPKRVRKHNHQPRRGKRRKENGRRHGSVDPGEDSSKEDEYSSFSESDHGTSQYTDHKRSKVRRGAESLLLSGDSSNETLQSRRRKRMKKYGLEGVKSPNYLPDIEEKGSWNHRNRRGSKYANEAGRLGGSGAADGGASQFQLPRITESSRYAGSSASRQYTESAYLQPDKGEHLPQLSPRHTGQDSQDTCGLQDSSWNLSSDHDRTASKKHHRSRKLDSEDTGSGTSQTFTNAGKRDRLMDRLQGGKSKNSSGKNPPQNSSMVRDKTVTVQQDVQLPVKQGAGVLKKSKRVRKPQQVSQEGTRQIQPSAPVAGKTTHEVVQLPEGDQEATGIVDLQELQSSINDDNPRRIGRKIVKKTRKPIDIRMAVNHNSKDLGTLVENTSTEDPATESTGSYRSSMVQGNLANDDVGLEQSISQCRSGHEVRLSSTTRGRNSASSAMPKKHSVLMSQDSEASSTTPILQGRTGVRATDSELLSSGLGAKVSATNQKPPFPPVKLKPIGGPVNELSEVTVSKRPNCGPGGGLFQDGGIPPVVGPTAGDPNTHLIAPQINDRTSEAGSDLEVSSEEEAEDDDEGEGQDGGEGYFPTYKLQEISGLCFTSPFSFSLFPMAGQYREAYKAVHKRSLQPISVSRATRGKLTRMRK